MNLQEDSFRITYAAKAPYHRMTQRLLTELKVRAEYRSEYTPINVVVYHMASQEAESLPAHDVYVNTKEMTYCVELHETPFCLIGNLDVTEAEEHVPCECRSVQCRKCGQHLMAMTSMCLEGICCFELECEHCSHYRDHCAADEITAELVERARVWYEMPHRKASKSSYHEMLDYKRKAPALTMAECFAIATTEVFIDGMPVLFPVVRELLEHQAEKKLPTRDGEEQIWTFKDGSTLESNQGSLQTEADKAERG